MFCLVSCIVLFNLTTKLMEKIDMAKEKMNYFIIFDPKDGKKTIKSMIFEEIYC